MAFEISSGFVQKIAQEKEDSSARLLNPWEEQLWDIHRQMRDAYRSSLLSKPQGLRRLSEYDLKLYISKQIVDFTSQYGDLFDSTGNKKQSSYLSEDNTVFIEEWKQIADAVDCIDVGDIEMLTISQLSAFHKTAINGYSSLSVKLQQFAIPALVTSHSRSVKESHKELQLLMRPTSLAGWVWSLIARDIADGITYSPCTGNTFLPGGEKERLSKRLAVPCGREVPNFSPMGRKMMHCSRVCSQRYYRKKQTQQKNVLSGEIITLEAETRNINNFKYGTPAGEAEFLNEFTKRMPKELRTLPPLPHWVRKS